MSGIGVIINRKAGRKIGRGLAPWRLGRLLDSNDCLRQTSSIDQIDEVIEEFRDRQIDILAIGGGDGSNHHVLSALVRFYRKRPLPLIAFLCGGTHNAHAASVGVHGQANLILARVAGRYHAGTGQELARRKLLRIDDGKGVRYGFSMATGFMYRFYKELHARLDDTSLNVARLIACWVGSFIVRGKAIREVFRLEPGKVTISGRALPWSENNGISCSSMEKLGLGFKPYPRANEHPDKFQAAALRIATGDFIRLMGQYWLGRTPEHPDQLNTITDSLLLEAEQPVSYVMDGELYNGSPRLEVTTGPALEVIIP